MPHPDPAETANLPRLSDAPVPPQGGTPTYCRAALIVLEINIAMVMGPTPPGTGVMA